MYTTVEIDFEVYKELTLRRESPEMTENDVLREIFDLPKESTASRSDGEGTAKPWVWKRVRFPHGTKFRAEYKGQTYRARAEDGAMVYDGNRFKSPSPAAGAVTGNSVNGWTFWECKLPGSNDWKQMSEIRAEQNS
jgi:hypothetical protein